MMRALILAVVMLMGPCVPVLALAQTSGQAGATQRFVLKSGSAMTGALGFPAGTASAPSWYFTADDDGTGTGIYRPGADQVGISANGGLVAKFASSYFRLESGKTFYMNGGAIGDLAGPVHIGSVTASTHSLTSGNDLILTGKLEVDGDIYADGNTYGQAFYLAGATTSYISGTGIQYQGTNPSFRTATYTVASPSNSITMKSGDQTNAGDYASGDAMVYTGATTTDGNTGDVAIYTGIAGAGQADAGDVRLGVHGDNGDLTIDGATGDAQFTGMHHQFGEMVSAGNATTITPVVGQKEIVATLGAGNVNGFTFLSGSTGSITAYADGSGSVTVTDVAHGLVTGNLIRIADSTNYNGTWLVTYLTDDTFSISDTWVSDDGASTWASADSLQVDVGSAGTYMVSVSASVFKAAGSSALTTMRVFQNGSALSSTGLIISNQIPGTDIGPIAAQGIVTLADGDTIALTIESDNTNDLTIKHANVSVTQL